MSLISDLASGKEFTLSSGSKLTIQYQSDANVISLGLGGNSVILADTDVFLLQRLFSCVKTLKQIESGK